MTEARVAVVVRIAGSGVVEDATVEPASVGETPLGRCLAGVARSTRFPRHPDATLAFRVPVRVESD